MYRQLSSCKQNVILHTHSASNGSRPLSTMMGTAKTMKAEFDLQSFGIVKCCDSPKSLYCNHLIQSLQQFPISALSRRQFFQLWRMVQIIKCFSKSFEALTTTRKNRYFSLARKRKLNWPCQVVIGKNAIVLPGKEYSTNYLLQCSHGSTSIGQGSRNGCSNQSDAQSPPSTTCRTHLLRADSPLYPKAFAFVMRLQALCNLDQFKCIGNIKSGRPCPILSMHIDSW